jgi:hypothetical protein
MARFVFAAAIYLKAFTAARIKKSLPPDGCPSAAL